MAMKIRFDSSNTPETPTFVLALNNGEKLGKLNAVDVNTSASLNDASEISFKVNKILDGVKCNLWDKIVDFKLVWCKEYDMWYQIKVEINDSEQGVSKSISCTQLGHAELSQLMLYDIEINTEDDIARDEYEIPTVLYNEEHKEASLLHRILEKAPHYSVIHVDSTIKNIQKTFSFDNKSIWDAFQEIAEEIGCIFILHSNSDENGHINRTISVYDIQSNCHDCGYRGEYTDVCPECGSSNIDEGYGEDTTIFVSSDELGNDITFSTDSDSVKNCFKLEAGDDLMTATVRNCNANGSDYIWYISDALKEDMSDELVEALNNYDDEYDYYQNDYIANINTSLLNQYNLLVNKYQKYKPELKELMLPIKGYPNLMTAYYDTIDFNLYLTSELMPTFEMGETTAEKEAAKLTTSSLSPVSVQNITSLSLSTANSAILTMAKVVVNTTYKIEIKSSSLNNLVWTGSFILTNYSDDEDTSESKIISIILNDNYEGFVKQKIEKLLNKHEDTDLSIIGLFKKDYDDFCNEIKKYCMNKLISFHDACQSCIDILIEQGIADNETWLGSDPNLYNTLYMPYRNKLSALEYEMNIREKEINLIVGVEDENGTTTTYGIQTYIIKNKNDIQDALNFQAFLGEKLWLEFCAFRREDKYSNSNYVSDGLNNVELFEKANEFIKVAKDEIYKSAERQHSISSSLKNLLVIKKFEKLVDYFEVGNWIRIRVDEEVYKLRLLSYEIDYNDLNEIPVEFSDVMKIANGLSDQRSIIEQASSMATTYNSVQRQASKGEKSNKVINDWFNKGLDATNTKIIGGADNQTQTWDNHGMLFRRHNAITDDYDDIQLKIINSTLAITDDGWETTKAAIGNFYYRDAKTNELKTAYGVNGEVLVGKLILGEGLGIYNNSGSLTFDEKGLEITNGTNTVVINPNSDKLFVLNNQETDIFYVDGTGKGYFKGSIVAESGSFGRISPFIINDYGLDGAASTDAATAPITSDSQHILFDEENYRSSFSIVITKDSEKDELNNIGLSLNVVDLVVNYSYTITTIIEDNSTDDSGAGGSGYFDDGDDTNYGENGIIVLSDVSEEIQTYSITRTETTTYTDMIKVRLVSSSISVKDSVSISLNKDTGVKTYTYTYTVTSGDMLTYLRNLIISRNSSIPVDTIMISSAVAFSQYTYNFTSYNLYSHIGTDYFDYSGLLNISNGKVTLANTDLNGDFNLSKNMYMGENTFIRGKMASNDYWRILGGGASDDGYLEIATADNGTEPIYIRQYTGTYQTIQRTLTLLDSSGNTKLPATLFVNNLKSNGATYLTIDTSTVFHSQVTYLGDSNQTGHERQLRFPVTSGTYTHNSYLYGGNSNSTTAIGLYDGKNNRGILVYNDVDNTVSVAGVGRFIFKDYSGTNRSPVSSTTGDKTRVSHVASNGSNQFRINAQWGNTSYSTRYVTTTSSDIRLKENVMDCDINALAFIDNIKVRSFDWKKDEGGNHQRIGFIADELEELDKMLVNGGGYNKDGSMDVKCINNFYLMGYVVKAIQELRKENNELKRQLKREV